MKRFSFFILLTMFMLPSFVMAQQDSISLYSLSEAIEHAIAHNRTIKNAGLSVKQAEAARWQAIASMLPQASATADYSNMCGYKMNFSGMEIPLNPYGTIGVTASLTFSGKQVVAALLQNSTIDIYNLSEALTRQKIVANVTTTYVTILATEATIELLEENLVNLNDLLAISRNSTMVGVTEQIQTDQLQVQVNQYINNINETRRSQEVLYNLMRFYMGLPAGKEIGLNESIEEIVSLDEALRVLGHDFNLEKNYDYQIAEEKVKLSERQIALAAMDYVPTISGYYQYSAKSYFGESEAMNMTPPNAVGAKVSIPLWTSGKNAAAVHEKRIACKVAENERDDKREELFINDIQYRYNLTSALENYEQQSNSVVVSQRVLDNISNKYKYGYSSSMEVTQASQDLIAAQSSYVQSVLEVVKAYVELKNLLNIE